MKGSDKSGLPKLALIAGPTASGKSALAMALAEQHGGVVINADSAQVYADLRIVTARPSATDEARVPHRLFGYIDGAESCSAARWAADARRAIDAAHREGRLPVLVGGTGLYLRTLLDGIAPVPPIDPAVRATVRAMPVADAYAALIARDPAAAATLHPADITRIARALETVRSTGRSIETWREARVGGIGDRVDLAAVVLLPPRDWLTERIDRRFAAMVADGAPDEVARLTARDDLPPDAPIHRAIGVPELARAVRGEATIDDAITAASLATRQYAKRQYTWFRNQPPAAWRRIETTDPADALSAVVARLR